MLWVFLLIALGLIAGSAMILLRTANAPVPKRPRAQTGDSQVDDEDEDRGW